MTKQIVHFMWVGDLEGSKAFFCQYGPTNLAKLDDEIEINVWVDDELSQQAKELFSAHHNITVRTITDMLDGKYKPLTHLDENQLESIKKTSCNLGAQKLYAAKKDFLSMLILSEFGGYFFDSTVRFTQKPDFPEVQDFRMLVGEKYRLNNLSEEEKETFRQEFDQGQYDMVFLEQLASRMGVENGFIPSDVWAIAACPGGSDFFREFFSQVIIEAEDYYNEKNDPSDITGGLVLGLISELMSKYHINVLMDEDWQNSHILYFHSEKNENSKDEKEIVEQIGLEKIHLQTWTKNTLYTVPHIMQDDYNKFMKSPPIYSFFPAAAKDVESEIESAPRREHKF